MTLGDSQVTREVYILRRIRLQGCACYLSAEAMSESLMIVALSPANPIDEAGYLTKPYSEGNTERYPADYI
jgi:hypothetical protein